MFGSIVDVKTIFLLRIVESFAFALAKVNYCGRQD